VRREGEEESEKLTRAKDWAEMRAETTVLLTTWGGLASLRSSVDPSVHHIPGRCGRRRYSAMVLDQPNYSLDTYIADLKH
jgi:hypothetical protein